MSDDGNFNGTSCVVKECLEAINFLNNKLKAIDSKISESLVEMKKELEVLMSIPGVGFTTAAGILVIAQ